MMGLASKLGSVRGLILYSGERNDHIRGSIQKPEVLLQSRAMPPADLLWTDNNGTLCKPLCI